MSIDASTLATFAAAFAKGMTAIRGRRVQRLLKREFAGADHVTRVRVATGHAVLGLSSHGAAYCATDGRGREASVVMWLHGSAEAVEMRFDLLKDSLPATGTRALERASLPPEVLLQADAGRSRK